MIRLNIFCLTGKNKCNGLVSISLHYCKHFTVLALMADRCVYWCLNCVSDKLQFLCSPVPVICTTLFLKIFVSSSQSTLQQYNWSTAYSEIVPSLSFLLLHIAQEFQILPSTYQTYLLFVSILYMFRRKAKCSRVVYRTVITVQTGTCDSYTIMLLSVLISITY